MTLNPKSDFELLLWERSKTKELEALLSKAYQDIGILKSELSEIKDLITTPGKARHVKHIVELQNVCREKAQDIEKYKSLYKKKCVEHARLIEKLALLNKK